MRSQEKALNETLNAQDALEMSKFGQAQPSPCLAGLSQALKFGFRPASQPAALPLTAGWIWLSRTSKFDLCGYVQSSK